MAKRVRNEGLSGPSCSIPQAAEALGMSRAGVCNAIERGDIHAVRIGKRVIIPTAPLREMLMLDGRKTVESPGIAA